YELIVVDDGSTDDTGELVKSYGSKVRYIYQENAGDGPARNAGIEAANGQWLAFLDHDDEWLGEKLELQMKLLSANPDLRWCATNFCKQSDGREAAAVEPDAAAKALGGKEYLENFFKDVQKVGRHFMTSTMVVHREAFEQAGVFDSCWLRCADLDMWWRIAYHFPKIGYVPQPLAVLHIGVQDAASTRLRLLTKRGGDARKLIARHLELSAKHGNLEDFKPLAARILKRRLLTTLYQGYGSDSRAIVGEFRDLFGPHWRVATRVLTVSPKLTSAAAKTFAYLRYKLGLERDVSRRWISAQSPEREGKD
ncbi:MAG: glycosyltransferase family 2 protein, partial [Planctomycetota bacterium]